MAETKGGPGPNPPPANPTTPAKPDASADRRDPLPAFCFKVTFSAFGGELFFRSVSGIGYDIKVEDTRAGGAGSNGRRLPGPVNWTNLSFKRGFTQDAQLLSWCNGWANRIASQMVRSDGTIELVPMDPANRSKPIYSWKFNAAFPAKLSLSEFDASKSDIVIESLDLAHEGLELQTGGATEAPRSPSSGSADNANKAGGAI